MSDWPWKTFQLIAWVAVALAFYFNTNVQSQEATANLSERIAVAEVRVLQETAGYRTMQEELARRIERLDNKIDNVIVRLDRIVESKQARN